VSTLLDEAYHVVHGYPGGARSLAPRLRKSEAQLCHEVSGTGAAKFGLVDAANITSLSGDLRILNAFAAHCGCMVLPMPHSDGSSDVLHQVAATSRDFANLVAHIVDAEADHAITGNELAEAERLWGVLVSQGQAVIGLLRAQHEAGVPVHFRTLEG
jgi:hypothetical protein